MLLPIAHHFGQLASRSSPVVVTEAPPPPSLDASHVVLHSHQSLALFSFRTSKSPLDPTRPQAGGTSDRSPTRYTPSSRFEQLPVSDFTF